jgi:hypothetical protein
VAWNGLTDAQRTAVSERAAHIRELVTGYRTGHAEAAVPGEPRPQYGPGQPLKARYQAKAKELGVGERTVERWAMAYRESGEAGLIDTRYLSFTDTLTTPLRAALHEHATALLTRLGISEPLTWEPPASCCEGITLPGRDPGAIDIDAVTRLVVTDGIPPGTAAAQLGTTISHVRLALGQAPRPAREWAPSTPPAAWGKWQDRARTLLTREFFDRKYLTARKTLHQIEAETGIPRAHLAARARDHGIVLTSAWQPTPIDPQWLREQYARRSYSDIAAELGVATETVIAAARRHGIPGRPKGVRSRPEMITALGDDIPPDIRRAVEGSLHGWQRLHRFRQAMSCPAIGIAARQIGAHPSALIHQFQRLEQDIGAQLYQRPSPGHPMRPTARGSALIQALDHPAVRAITPLPPAA